MIKVGIIGATGYAGQQLLWILKNHKKVKVELVRSSSRHAIPFSSVDVSTQSKWLSVPINSLYLLLNVTKCRLS